MKTVLTNCTVIDCLGNPPRSGMTVVIDGDRIAELKPGIYQPADQETGTRVFDLDGGYVLPGLWDVHEHLGDLYPDPNHVMHGESTLTRTIRADRAGSQRCKIQYPVILILSPETIFTVIHGTCRPTLSPVFPDDPATQMSPLLLPQI